MFLSFAKCPCIDFSVALNDKFRTTKRALRPLPPCFGAAAASAFAAGSSSAASFLMALITFLFGASFSLRVCWPRVRGGSFKAALQSSAEAKVTKPIVLLLPSRPRKKHIFEGGIFCIYLRGFELGTYSPFMYKT